MQADDKEIYKKTAHRNGIDEELVADVGRFVFQAWRDWQNAPDNLLLKVEGLGRQLVRKKLGVERELDRLANSYSDFTDESNNHFENEDKYIQYKNNQAWFENMLLLKDIYKDFSLEKQKIRKLRNEVQKPLEKLSKTDIQQKISKKPGEDYFDEY